MPPHPQFTSQGKETGRGLLGNPEMEGPRERVVTFFSHAFLMCPSPGSGGHRSPETASVVGHKEAREPRVPTTRLSVASVEIEVPDLTLASHDGNSTLWIQIPRPCTTAPPIKRL